MLYNIRKVDMEKDNNILKVDIVAEVDSHISGNKMVEVCNGNIVEVECC